MVAPWAKYKVGEPSSRPNYHEDNCRPLLDVSHVCHLPDAQRILEDGRIRSSLVWDDCELQNTRTCVSWISPNFWGRGSIYGNIEFVFSWDKVERKKLYWIKHYLMRNTDVCVFLVTDQDYSSHGLREYDPQKGDGPLWNSGNGWYFNNKINIEVMADRDLLLADCRRIGFVDHKNDVCKKDGNSCQYSRTKGYEAGGRLLAYIIGRGIKNYNNMLLGEIDHNYPLAPIGNSIAWIKNKLCEDITSHPIANIATIHKIAFINISSLAVGLGRDDLASSVMNVFSGEREAEECINRALRNHFGVA